MASKDIEGFVTSLATPRTTIVMVQAGKGTDAVIDRLADLFEEGDIILDGGNANFQDTRLREAALASWTRSAGRRRRHLPHPVVR